MIVSLLAAVALHAAVVAGGWIIGGSIGATVALLAVVVIEHRLARARAFEPLHREERRAHRRSHR